MKKHRIVQITGLIFLLIGSASCQRSHHFSDVEAMVTSAMKSVEMITVGDLKAMMDNGDMFLLIDVREPEEHNAGYIPGSMNIPRGTLEFKIANEDFWEAEMLYMPEKNEPIVLYCKKGKRSILAARSLHELGYRNVRYLDEGWKQWELTWPLIYEKNLDKVKHNEVEEAGGC